MQSKFLVVIDGYFNIYENHIEERLLKNASFCLKHCVVYTCQDDTKLLSTQLFIIQSNDNDNDNNDKNSRQTFSQASVSNNGTKHSLRNSFNKQQRNSLGQKNNSNTNTTKIQFGTAEEANEWADIIKLHIKFATKHL
jgi:hypothetical protein